MFLSIVFAKLMHYVVQTYLKEQDEKARQKINEFQELCNGIVPFNMLAKARDTAEKLGYRQQIEEYQKYLVLPWYESLSGFSKMTQTVEIVSSTWRLGKVALGQAIVAF